MTFLLIIGASLAGGLVAVLLAGTVSEAVLRFKSEQVCAASAPNVESHSGMGGRRR